MTAEPPSAPSAPSAPLERAVEVMDQLRSPGGCPWDADQTHRSLARYLVEETYEVLEAIETDDAALLREELGDLLLQVLFHARVASERTDGSRFSIDDVADDLVAKLVWRHPHVFGDAVISSVAEQNESWEQLKIAEKARTSPADGVPLAQPALALAGKLVSRARRAGLNPELAPPLDAETRIGLQLLTVVEEAVSAGVDPESALRRVAREYRQAITPPDVTS